MNPVYIILIFFIVAIIASVAYTAVRIKRHSNSRDENITGGSNSSARNSDREIRELCKTLTPEELYNKACELTDEDGYPTDRVRWEAFMGTAADKGYIPAVRELGIYKKGNDNVLALELLYRAAGEGDSKAAEELYDLYYYGSFGGKPKINKDRKKAVEIIQPLADSGNAVAQRLLAEYYYYEEDNEKKAKQLYLKAAEGGDAEAMVFQAGVAFEDDNYEEHLKWLLKAAEQNYADAESDLGYFFKEVEDIELGSPDLPQAMQWYKRASEHGDKLSTCKVGEMYLNGEGTIKDEYEAFKWFKKATEEGSVCGKYQYGRCFMNGIGVAQDKAKGIKLYTEAARYDEDAQFALGMCYLEGNGVKADKNKAVSYFKKVEEHDYISEEIQTKLDELKASGVIE